MNDKRTLLDIAYAECTKLGHHVLGSLCFHNGACQEGYNAAKERPFTTTKESEREGT